MSRAKHLFRIASLLVPSAIAWYVAYSATWPSTFVSDRDDVARVITHVLAPMWIVVASAFGLRLASVVGDPDRNGASVLERASVLTSTGVVLSWVSAGAVASAVWLGWASLAVLGMLGTAIFHILVFLAHVALRNGDPTKGATFERTFTPHVVSEGDEVVEEIRVKNARIPIGFRMFVSGRVGPRWATTRHVLESAESGAEIVLESEIGPAVRGEHEAEPLAVWVEDCFGLCRSPRTSVAATRLRVLPKPVALPKTPLVKDAGIGPRAPKPASRLPTEGNLALREYQQGDDARRIHWVRSLAARELIVRLPDEIPPDRPRVRLVLDTFFPEAAALECDAPGEALDALVRVWLAVGKELAEQGVHVTLVAALVRPDRPGEVDVVRQRMLPRTPARDLGARIAWQDRVSVDKLFTGEHTLVVSRGVTAPQPEDGSVRWILVFNELSEPPLPATAGARLPHPMGAPENRWTSRRRVADARAREWGDRAKAVSAMRTFVTPPPRGSFAAILTSDGAVRVEEIAAS